MKENDEIIKVENDKSKSDFEQLIQNSFKESNITESYSHLLKAYNELPNYIDQIKNSRKIAYIINTNIIDKINRLSQRNYININILLSKILYTILNALNFALLSDDSKTLIFLSNTSMNLLELISSYELYYNLIKRVITFLNFLKNNSEKFLNNEQLSIIDNIKKNLGEKIYSNEYNTFGNNYQKDIIVNFYKESLNEREKGLINLNNYFFRLKTLNEQFDLLCVYGYLILNAIMNKANQSYIELYYKTADFFINFVYNFFYTIKSDNNINNNFNPNNFYLCDNNNIKLEHFDNNNNPENLNFLTDKKFELDDDGKYFLLILSYYKTTLFYFSSIQRKN